MGKVIMGKRAKGKGREGMRGGGLNVLFTPE